MGMLKNYKNAQITKNYGVRCITNATRDFLLHHHDYYALEVIAEGEICHECNGKSMMLSGCDVYILSPDDVHRLRSSQKTTIYNLCIYPAQCNKFIARLLLEEQYPRFGRLTGDAIAELATLHKALSQEMHSTQKYREARILASRLLEQTVSEARLKSDHSYSTVAKAMTFIAENLSEAISLEAVAAVSGYSRTYFSKLFKEIVGCNFKDCLARERINLASDLLESEKTSITEIVYAVGFNSYSSFWRTFKRYKGISPEE